MSKRIFKSDLSISGISNIISQLHDYEDEIIVKANMVVRQLAEMGIKVAEYSVYNEFRPFIDFVYKPDFMTETEVEGNLIGKDNTLIQRVWYGRKGQMAGVAYISPVMMSEFGAGPYAQQGHRGSFPGQKHAFEPKWFWRDEAGMLHSSEEDYTMVATQPMYHAFIEMMQKADKVVRQVFGVE